VELVVANAEEKLARDRLTYAAWGEPLALEQWLEREQRLCAHPWAQQTMTWWLWRGDDSAVLSSCETYRMRSSLRGSTEHGRGSVRSGDPSARRYGETWAVASVYTEPALRGRGHARRMMDALVARARAEGAQASTLFSDVGAPIYEASGYVARPAEDLVLTPLVGDPALGVDALLGEVVDVREPDGAFAVWPTRDQLDWHVERARVYRPLLDCAPLPAVGARAGDGVILWTTDAKQTSLKIVWLDAARRDQAEALLVSARRVAHALDLGEVRVWAQPWPFAIDGKREPRDGSLPMIAPLVPSLRADDWTQIPRAVWV
jgi:GNAT superfamily N-acetyltransferase